jgi:hypothetical protein
MRVSVASLLLAGLFLTTACHDAAPGSEQATFRPPGSDFAVTIERRPLSRVFAEYRRALILQGTDRGELARLAMFDDAGGYSRTNVYRDGGSAYVLRDAEASYTVHIRPPSVRRDSTRRGAGAYIGAFDVDSAGRWRFIPATEQPERPAEFRGG